jgi:NADH:ubiquinone oxidoreductase subunit F (NADH-binding)
VDGRPTLVQNVETIANMAQIAAYGDRWFRGVGSPTEPGTMLVTVGGAVARPGVAEVAFGTPLSLALEAGGGPTGGMSGVLVGGYFGIWLDGEQARAATLSVEGLRAFGAAPGCGAIAVLPDGTCGLLETCRIMSWLASQSAGQCGPCVNGLASIAGAVRRAYRGEADDAAFARMLRWTREVEGRGACRLPDGAVRFLRSALRVFAADVELHRRGGRCDGAGGPPILPTPSVPVPS